MAACERLKPTMMQPKTFWKHHWVKHFMYQKTERPRILYSCYTNVSREGEHFVPEHIFGYIVSGSTELYPGGKTYIFKEGSFRFIRKNQLAKFVKQPPAGGEFKTISVSMDRATLQNISNELGLQADGPYLGENVLTLQSNPLFVEASLPCLCHVLTLPYSF